MNKSINTEVLSDEEVALLLTGLRCLSSFFIKNCQTISYGQCIKLLNKIEKKEVSIYGKI